MTERMTEAEFHAHLRDWLFETADAMCRERHPIAAQSLIDRERFTALQSALNLAYATIHYHNTEAGG